MTTYYTLQTGSKALAITPLTLQPTNPLDKLQHWSLTPATPEDGLFVVARTTGQVIDVTDGKLVEKNPVGVYTKKTSGNQNQRFTFTSPGNIAVIGTKLNLFSADPKVVLSAQDQIFTAVPIPANYVITVQNTTSGALTISYDNAPASEQVKSWPVSAGGTVPVTLPAGASISVKDANGKVLPPTPTIVSKDATLTFVDPPPVAKLTYFSTLDQIVPPGKKLEYNGDEPNLGTSGWNDVPLSFRVDAGTWIIYQDYYTGSKIVANARGGTNLDGNYFNGKWGGYPGTVAGISSHRLLPNAGLAFFDNYEFQGNYLTVNDDVPDLTALKFDNRINSLVVVSGTWELWDRTYYQGAKRIVTLDGGRDGTGWFNLPQQWGGRANSLMSIRRVSQ